MVKKILVMMLLICGIMSSQGKDYFPELAETDYDNLVIHKNKYFDGNSLWGHINGGADQYLEYGFDKLLFQDIEISNTKLRVEFYRMSDAEAAFGIFSIMHYKCEDSDTLTKFICVSQYQLQASVGRFYISIINEKGDEATQKLVLELFAKVLKRCDETELIFPQVLNSSVLNEYLPEMKIIRGVLGFQNGFPKWERKFEKYEGYTTYILPVDQGKAKGQLAYITFGSEADLMKFAEQQGFDLDSSKTRQKIKTDSKYKVLVLVSSPSIVYMESDYDCDPLIDKILK